MDRIEQLSRFLQESPDDSFLKHALALEHVKNGNDEVAVILFREILAQDPTYIGSYYHLGKALERLGEPEQAIEVYETGMKRSREAQDNHAYNELQSAHEDAFDI